MHYTNYEKETLILYNDEEKIAVVETANAALQRRLDSFCEQSKDIVCVKDKPPFKEYRLPKKWGMNMMPKQYTDEEKEALRERGRELYQKLLDKKSADKPKNDF